MWRRAVSVPVGLRDTERSSLGLATQKSLVNLDKISGVTGAKASEGRLRSE